MFQTLGSQVEVDGGMNIKVKFKMEEVEKVCGRMKKVLNPFVTDTSHCHAKLLPLNQLSLPVPFENRGVYNSSSLSLQCLSVYHHQSTQARSSHHYCCLNHRQMIEGLVAVTCRGDTRGSY